MAKPKTTTSKAPGAAKNVTIYMTEREHQRLIKLGRDADMTYSAIVRRLVAAYAAGEVTPRSLPRVERRIRRVVSNRENVARAKQRAALAARQPSVLLQKVPQNVEHAIECRETT